MCCMCFAHKSISRVVAYLPDCLYDSLLFVLGLYHHYSDVSVTGYNKQPKQSKHPKTFL